jgi:hypothetical protein
VYSIFYQNYSNLFNLDTEIRFYLPETAYDKLSIFTRGIKKIMLLSESGFSEGSMPSAGIER